METQELTPEHRENLEMLAAYLASGYTRMRFDMADYCKDQDGSSLIAPLKVGCGTVGCALGHGVDATGIPGGKTSWGWGLETWPDYAQRVFGGYFPFLFAGAWAYKNENRPEQAADRIAYFLDCGDPIFNIPSNIEEIAVQPAHQRPWSGYFRRSGRISVGDILGRLPTDDADREEVRAAVCTKAD